MSHDTYRARHSVPGMVDRALDRNYVARARVSDDTEASPEKFSRIAELYERDARWWDVLSRWFLRGHSYDAYQEFGASFWVFQKAVLGARQDARQYAKFYRELAGSERDRAARKAVAA